MTESNVQLEEHMHLLVGDYTYNVVLNWLEIGTHSTSERGDVSRIYDTSRCRNVYIHHDSPQFLRA